MLAEFATVSILAAFLGGLLAFFAPCCVTFMLPSYFAFAFKEKTKIIKMTLVFMLGLLVVFLPIAFALAGIGQLVSQFHTQLFIAGGLFLLAMAIVILAGRSLSMPFHPKQPSLKKMDAPAVFQLGIFSGLASSCCLPVLAGVLALSTLSGSWIQAGVLVWAYVIGMTAPLLISALVWDKYKLNNSKIIQGKILEFTLLGKKRSVHSSNLISAIILFAMGLMTLYLAVTQQITVTSTEQINFAILIKQVEQTVTQATAGIPDWIFLLALIGITGFLIFEFIRKDRTEKENPINEKKDSSENEKQESKKDCCTSQALEGKNAQ